MVKAKAKRKSKETGSPPKQVNHEALVEFVADLADRYGVYADAIQRNADQFDLTPYRAEDITDGVVGHANALNRSLTTALLDKHNAKKPPVPEWLEKELKDAQASKQPKRVKQEKQTKSKAAGSVGPEAESKTAQRVVKRKAESPKIPAKPKPPKPVVSTVIERPQPQRIGSGLFASKAGKRV